MTITHGLIVRRNDAEHITDGPTSTLDLLTDCNDGSPVTVNTAHLALNSPGAPPHRHAKATELLYILDGVAEVLLGDTIHRLTSGDLVVIPAGIPHAFATAAGHSADLLVTLFNGVPRFDYYRLLQRLHRGEATTADIAASGPLYDNYYVDNGLWRVRER